MEGRRFSTASSVQESAAWLESGILKTRNSASMEEKRGRRLFGGEPDRKVQEHGVWYALDLCMNRDASLYLDTRNLRLWAKNHLRDQSVLNTFAYTGSLGVAALAGGANRVIQMDLNRQFLNLAKTSYTLNGFPIYKEDFISGDFWSEAGRLKRIGERFDCVLLDPPFFSATSKGRLDLNMDSARLINKVRPLINDGGWLVSINNALYVSGEAYLQTLERLSRGRVFADRRVDPGAGGLQRNSGNPQRRAGHRPGAVQPLDEDRNPESEEEKRLNATPVEYRMHSGTKVPEGETFLSLQCLFPGHDGGSGRGGTAGDVDEDNRADNDQGRKQYVYRESFLGEQAAEQDRHHWIDVGIGGHQGDRGGAQQPGIGREAGHGSKHNQVG